MRYAELIEKAITAALALKPNEALFLPSECVIARSNTGRLRFGSGNQWPRWVRGDGEELLREHLEGVLDWAAVGYFAGRYATDLRNGYCLKPVPVIGVGKRDFYPDRERMAAMA